MQEVDRALRDALQAQDVALGVTPPLNPLHPRRSHYDSTGQWLLGRSSAAVREVHTQDHTLQGEGAPLLLRQYLVFDELSGTDQSYGSSALLWFHGGGWVYGSIASHDALCRALALYSGRSVWSVQYRLAPEHPWPAALDDARQAWQFLRLQGIPNVAIGGDSSGGHLALALDEALAREGEHGPESLALLYPVVCPLGQTHSFEHYAQGYGLSAEAMLDFWAALLGVSPGQDSIRRQSALSQLARLRERADLVAPAAYMPRSDGPPAYFLLAQHDVLHDEAVNLAQGWKDSGRGVWLHAARAQLHGFARYHGLVPEADRALRDWVTAWT